MSAAAFARGYCGKLGMVLTYSPPGEKGPRHPGWNDPANAITDPVAAHAFWDEHPDYGIGALLEPSRQVSFDVDHVEYTRAVLSGCGINIDELDGPRIVGRPDRFRLMYRAPDQALKHRTLSWPQKDDPRKGFVLFELRAGLVSDALPPTIHVGTGKPYVWAVPPREGFPPLPQALLDLWLDWENFQRYARRCCPWAPPPAPERPKSRRTVEPGKSVIAAFNAAHDPAAILEAFGYQRQGKRFAAPGTQHAAGIVELDSGKVFCHHLGDVLGGEHALDAFDLYVRLEHGGDMRAAVRAAAAELGLNERLSA